VKRYMVVMAFAVLLSGCEDASVAISKAQEAANQVIDSVQENLALLDPENLNIEQFGAATERANALLQSVQGALNVDLNDPAAVADVEGHIANAYGCLVDHSSPFVADKLVEKLLSTVNNADVLALVERGIEKGTTAGKCVV
jgi:ribosomal protein RSM22 (predicted rRNA methylase)